MLKNYKMKENLTTKCIWEFKAGDSIYASFKPKGETDAKTFLCEFIHSYRNRVKVKVIEALTNPEIYKHKIETAVDEETSSRNPDKGWCVSVSYLQCGLWGKANGEIRAHFHWFQPFGYAYKDIDLTQDEKSVSHPSFGTIVLSKPTSSAPVSLFGSNIQHKNTISLSIHRASIDRHLNNDWIHSKEEVIEIEMSATQFSDMITSFGNGGGTPVTIRHVNRESYPDPPFESKIDVIHREFEGTVENIGKKMQSSIEDSINLLKNKTSITKSDREAIIKSFDSLVSVVQSHIPFISQQFNEEMETSITQAKGEIEAFFNHKITSLGLEAAKANPQNFLPEISIATPENK